MLIKGEIKNLKLQQLPIKNHKMNASKYDNEYDEQVISASKVE